MKPRPHLQIVQPLPAHAGESEEDRARERRIEQLGIDYLRHAKAGPMATAKCAEIFAQIRLEVAARSPEQVRRMERAKGLCR